MYLSISPSTKTYISKEATMTNVYEKLRERLDMFPQGFPKTNSGVELEILENLFSPDEAQIALALRPYGRNLV